ncbi:MAG TPA: hypothetical protein PLU98_00030 [Mesotoga infera]|nr:hypothetical protein [Mesotoga infera]
MGRVVVGKSRKISPSEERFFVTELGALFFVRKSKNRPWKSERAVSRSDAARPGSSFLVQDRGKTRMPDQVRHDGKGGKTAKMGTEGILTSVPFFAKTGILTSVPFFAKTGILTGSLSG